MCSFYACDSMIFTYDVIDAICLIIYPSLCGSKQVVKGASRMTTENMGLVDVGLQIRNLRDARRMSQRELSEKIGLSRSYIANVETGAINPSVDALTRVAEVLGVPLSAIVDPAKVEVPYPPEVDSVASLGRISEIIAAVQRLRVLPGAASGIYDKMETNLAEELAGILDVPILTLYKTDGPLGTPKTTKDPGFLEVIFGNDDDDEEGPKLKPGEDYTAAVVREAREAREAREKTRKEKESE